MLALTLPNEDVLFVHYKVPTIIMSRACDQFEKVRRNASVSLLSIWTSHSAQLHPPPSPCPRPLPFPPPPPPHTNLLPSTLQLRLSPSHLLMGPSSMLLLPYQKLDLNFDSTSAQSQAHLAVDCPVDCPVECPVNQIWAAAQQGPRKCS